MQPKDGGDVGRAASRETSLLHAVLLWEPDHLSVQGLYASRSLAIVSNSSTLITEGT